MSAPRALDQVALRRVVRYLVGCPRLVYQFAWRGAANLDTYVDSDFAGCAETRRSTSGGCLMLGGHLLKHWSSTRKTIALSSGEAELSGILKGTGEALGVQSLAADLGLAVGVEVRTDASAAVGICRRAGIGKVRHLAVGQLWVQERLMLGDFPALQAPRRAKSRRHTH